jgi:NAD(P)-dependent dehydrogenase (short-subunit alcohol dehydrogenase family)
MTDNSPVRVALVTGANRGIGLAVCEGLAQHGLRVLLSARRAEDAQAAAASLTEAGLRVTPLQLDVTDQASVNAAAREVDARFGRLDVLVNNAGANYDKPKEPTSVDLAIAQHAFEVNALGPWRTSQAFIPLMQRGGYGRIVNVSSGSGRFSLARDGSGPAYAVSKAALNMLTLKLALALQGTGILVNAACPGWVRTRMGGWMGRSLEEGADTLIWLATLPDDGPTGGFFYDRTPKAW